MPKGVPNKKYAPEFNTDRIYLRESLKALVLFRGHPKKPPKAVEEDLLAEAQRLRTDRHSRKGEIGKIALDLFFLYDLWRPVLSMVTTMLDKAFGKIPDVTGLILHSDLGWHYYLGMPRKKASRA